MKNIIISNPKTISKTAASSKQSAKKQTSTSKRTSTSKKQTIKGGRVRRLIEAGRDIDDMEKLRGLSAASATCLDTADFLAADLEDAPLVKGLFNKGEVVALVGSSKSGNAPALALHIAVSVASGVPLFASPKKHVVSYANVKRNGNAE